MGLDNYADQHPLVTMGAFVYSEIGKYYYPEELMKPIADLLQLKRQVYVYLPNRQMQQIFLTNAEAEGFTFGDGVKPTEREADDIYRIKPDRTICFVGWVGHMAFRSKDAHSAVPMIWVDYAKYTSGNRRYVIKRIRPKWNPLSLWKKKIGDIRFSDKTEV